MMFNRALVPLDGTEASKAIIPFMTQMAKGMNMGVVLARAIDIQHMHGGLLDRVSARIMATLMDDADATSPDPSAGDKPSEDQLRKKIAEEARVSLDDLADRIALKGIPAATSVGFGPAAGTIIRMAQESDCDIIAMSTRGRSVLASGLLGSVTYRVMHESPVPVLAITPERAGMQWADDYGMNRVIVPLDGSEFAESVLPYVAALSRGMNMRISLLTAVHLDNLVYSDSGILSGSTAELETAAKEEARYYLEAVSGRLRASGLDVDVEVLRGKPSTQITKYAQETGHCMIALTTHGRTGLSRMMLGSVAEAVVRESGEPVLVVRSDSHAYELLASPAGSA